MKRASFGTFALILSSLILATLVLASCGTAPNTQTGGSGLKLRIVVSQSVASLLSAPGVVLIDALLDVRARVATISAGNNPGLLLVTPDKKTTIAFSVIDTRLNYVNNTNEASSGSTLLPGFTESLVVSPDSATLFAAVPTAPVTGQSPGAIQLVNLSTNMIYATVPVPSVRYLAVSHNGNRVLAFSDNQNYTSVITPANVGTSTPAVVTVGGFDRPVAGFFSSDDNIAYILNCGSECGGSVASLQTLDLVTNTPGTPLPVDAASTGLLNGNTLYVVGTPTTSPANSCTGQTTAATTCGRLTVVDVSQMTVTTSGIVITDGYHNRISLGPNGLLFIGARTCTNITGIAPAEIRGCLSVFNTATLAVTIPPQTGDATGFQPIPNRNVMYLTQGGELWIYDTGTGTPVLQVLPPQIDISGDAVDVKLID